MILRLSESFFQTVLEKKIFLEFITNHNDSLTELLLNTKGHALLNNLRKKMSNQAIFNESGEIKKSEKLGKSGQVGTF